ncbi:hypothetical protein DdX_14781 [Ditylenchus destructor]|uniref:Uncharacterized protein n=1 Tax=Ditylenchus destructor TaxID=166010 RepID=A0AAD4QYA7_9BILA|nr:hypothetical protein DdX_14781 [Ditylenchus destructor]
MESSLKGIDCSLLSRSRFQSSDKILITSSPGANQSWILWIFSFSGSHFPRISASLDHGFGSENNADVGWQLPGSPTEIAIFLRMAFSGKR